ncbi:hypothetical protein [Bradyrhizobium sp. 141]|nr:hypothetical protein [Bradyrhizobium sp. 141]MCK1721351.1 hypothetical protein [Bradyrhizobium sp. 141]
MPFGLLEVEGTIEVKQFWQGRREGSFEGRRFGGKRDLHSRLPPGF